MEYILYWLINWCALSWTRQGGGGGPKHVNHTVHYDTLGASVLITLRLSHFPASDILLGWKKRKMSAILGIEWTLCSCHSDLKCVVISTAHDNIQIRKCYKNVSIAVLILYCLHTIVNREGNGWQKYWVFLMYWWSYIWCTGPCQSLNFLL